MPRRQRNANGNRRRLIEAKGREVAEALEALRVLGSRRSGT